MVEHLLDTVVLIWRQSVIVVGVYFIIKTKTQKLHCTCI